jgi:hypothetical protein
MVRHTDRQKWRATKSPFCSSYDLPPNALDEFLALWALGTLFEKLGTLIWLLSRANKVLRICITCLDHTLILAQLDPDLHYMPGSHLYLHYLFR